ncbi:MAG: hypothetical protein WCA38_11715, partial [Candidatus Acidiferrales bacterium]
MDEERFNQACQLRDDGKFEESFREFINIANDTDDPNDKAAAILYAAVCLKMLRDWERARQQLDIARLLIAESNLASGNSDEREW